MARRHRLRARRARYPGGRSHDALKARDFTKKLVEVSVGVHEVIQRFQPRIASRPGPRDNVGTRHCLLLAKKIMLHAPHAHGARRFHFAFDEG